MDRSKIVPKVNPILDTKRIAQKTIGLRTQKDQDVETDRRSRFSGDQIRPIVTISTPYWYREGLGGAGDSSYATRMPIPDGASTFNSVSSWNMVAPCAGWIVGAFMELSQSRTAGTIMGRAVIDEITTDFGEALTVDVSSVNMSKASFFTPFSEEFPFAEDSTIRANFITSGAYAPSTTNGRIWFILRLDVT